MISINRLNKITKSTNEEFLSKEVKSFIENRLIESAKKGFNSCIFYASDFSFAYPDEYVYVNVSVFDYVNGYKVFKGWKQIKRLKNEYSILKNRINVLKLVESYLSSIGFEISYEDPFLNGCKECYDFKGNLYKLRISWGK